MKKSLLFLVGILICGIILWAGTLRMVAASAFLPQNISLNWAGYIAEQGSFTEVHASWTVPKVRNAKAFKTDATWVGIGGVRSTDLIQAGTEAVTGIGGAVQYQAWFETLPDYSQPVSLAVSGGDSVSVSISRRGADMWKIIISNVTTGASYNTNVTYHSSLSSAEWIEEMPSDGIGLIPLDSFRSVTFSGAGAIKNGARVTIAGSGAQPVAMAGKSGNVLAMASSLKKKGDMFTVKRVPSKKRMRL